ncbi:hypothetical protein SCLCIDRAFT_1207047 [Scleroderma citrinum Foug A]|uniref:Uncharacterized protein n=1 Tax=Scleroderma citrinum Foug A TaxID=1036808 RepID=A0A0C3ERW7_9AGAM|nr:hypothetical protein SCLCIDRAFT_1207047 [Scleroderma citrinum Foug A]
MLLRCIRGSVGVCVDESGVIIVYRRWTRRYVCCWVNGSFWISERAYAPYSAEVQQGSLPQLISTAEAKSRE